MNRPHWRAGKWKLYWARCVEWRFLLFSCSHVQLLVTPWSATHQASLSFTISLSLFKLMSTESVRPFNYLILCHPLLLLPSVFPSIRVFSNELAFCIRWLKNWSFSFSISPSNEYSGLMSFKIDWDWSPCCPKNTQESSSTPLFKSKMHQFFGAQPSLLSHPYTTEKP